MNEIERNEQVFAFRKGLKAGLHCSGATKGVVVKIDAVSHGIVTYSWVENGKFRAHSKWATAFWVRYRPIVFEWIDLGDYLFTAPNPEGWFVAG